VCVSSASAEPSLSTLLMVWFVVAGVRSSQLVDGTTQIRISLPLFAAVAAGRVTMWSALALVTSTKVSSSVSRPVVRPSAVAVTARTPPALSGSLCLTTVTAEPVLAVTM
jgi:hypothetical protein